MGWRDAPEIEQPKEAKWSDAPLDKPAGSSGEPQRGKAALGGVNTGIAGVVGLPVDTIENVLNLGIAAYGRATGTTPSLIEKSLGGSRWLAEKMQSAGIQTENPNPEDLPSRALHLGGTVVGSGGRRAVLPAGAAVVASETLGPQWAAPASMLPATAAQASRRPVDPKVTQAKEAGYVLPPDQANPSLWNKLLVGFAGKAATQQGASVRNQEITDKLARRSIGLKDDAPLSEAIIAEMRAKEGAHYQAVKDFGDGKLKFKPDATFKKDLESLEGDYAAAAKEFPEIASNKAVASMKETLLKGPMSPTAAVELSKKLRHDAKANFKGYDDPEKLELARAQRGAADAIDGLIERVLTASGKSDLAANYKQARENIVRLYDVDAALGKDGHVSAAAVAKMSARKPLAPEMSRVADVASSFPKATQDVSKLGSQPVLSPLDYLAGGAGYFIDPHLAAIAASRPVVRYGLLSQPYQATRAPESGINALMRASVLANQ